MNANMKEEMDRKRTEQLIKEATPEVLKLIVAKGKRVQTLNRI
jgi:hypothetical protein